MAQEQVRQFIDQATQSIQSGQFEGALSLIDQALALSPDDPDAHILRGICLSQTGQPAAATDAFNRAISLDPNSAKARYNLAVHQYALGQKSEALANARQASALDPSHSGARQLIQNLETELAGPSPRSGSSHNDPLAMPPVATPPPAASAPPPGTPSPQANPYTTPPPAAPTSEARPEPAMPSPPPSGPGPQPVGVPPANNPYHKSAYENAAHSIPFVENMGNAWVGLGWFLSVVNLIGLIAISIVMVRVMGMNLSDQAAIMAAMEKDVLLVWTFRICGFGSVLGILVWSIMDLIDQRGNFVWLLPNIACTCCGFGWLTLPIYILAGRNK